MGQSSIARIKSTGKLLTENNVFASLILTYIIPPVIAWLGAQLLKLNQSAILVSVLAGVTVGLGPSLWFRQQWKNSSRETALEGVKHIAIGKYNQDLDDLQQSKSIDMIAITFHAFGAFKGPVEEAFKKGATIRVLLLDASCLSFKEYLKKPSERREAGLVEEGEQAAEVLENIQNKYNNQAGTGRIFIRYFTSIPYRGCIITDATVHYWPYLYHEHPENTPTYFILSESKIGQILKNEFNVIWGEAHAR